MFLTKLLKFLVFDFALVRLFASPGLILVAGTDRRGARGIPAFRAPTARDETTLDPLCGVRRSGVDHNAVPGRALGAVRPGERVSAQLLVRHPSDRRASGFVLCFPALLWPDAALDPGPPGAVPGFPADFYFIGRVCLAGF